MKSIDILEREHLWIGWMAESLEALLARAKAQGVLDEMAYELFSLYEVFADGRHQDKEEEVLFPALLTAADDAERALLGQLLSDHENERRHMASMRVNLFGAVHGEPRNLLEFVRSAGEYLDLHRVHMLRENQVLLPMAARLLDDSSDAATAAGFEALEGGSGDPHGIREQILGLRRRVGLPQPPAA